MEPEIKRWCLPVGLATLVALTAAVAQDRPPGPPPEEQCDRPLGPPPSVERSVENLPNGVRITLIATDAEQVARLQEHEQRQPEGPGRRLPEGVTRTVTNTARGVVVSLIAEDEETVQRLQQRAAEAPPGPPPGDRGRAGEGPGPGGGERDFGPPRGERQRPGASGARPPGPPPGVERTITNLANGVRITLTTDDQETVQQLQSHRPPERRHEPPPGVAVEVSNLTNGVTVTITSDDPDEVARIQAHAEQGPPPPPPGGPGGPGRHRERPE